MLSRELKSLQDEIVSSQSARAPSLPDRAMAGNTKAVSEAPAPMAKQPADDGEEDRLRSEFGEFINEATKFFEEAEKNVAAHPAASVAGALVVGILIRRLLANR
jgi:ElaB/YqjD/DUF883 family membrane-anchored ribosome-binding protein